MARAIRVLYVDDYALDRELVRDALEREHQGFVITEAASQAELHAQLATDCYDVVLTDFNILGFEGLQVLDLVRERLSRVPVVLVTGTGSEEVAVAAMKRGAADYVIKTPRHILRLPYTIRAVLEAQRQKDERQRVEASLRESEARYRTLVEGSLQGISIHQNDVIQFANPAMARMFGYDEPADLVGKVYSTLVAPHEQARLQANSVAHLRGEATPSSVEYQGVRKQGTVIWLQCQVTVITWNQHPAVLTTYIDITERKRLEREILEVSSREQQRLGQELHDDLGQALAGIAYLAQGLQAQLQVQGRPEAAAVARIGALLAQAREQTQRLARGLYPTKLETHGFLAALQEFAASVEALYGTACLIAAAPPLSSPDRHVALHLYRIVQEAVNNAIRHGKARSILIRLRQTATVLELIVEDDGIGLPIPLGPSSGMGLPIMQYRAGMIGATLEIQRLGERGTRVACRWPALTGDKTYDDTDH